MYLFGKSGRVDVRVHVCACVHTHTQTLLSGWQFLSGMGRQVCTGFAAKKKGRVCCFGLQQKYSFALVDASRLAGPTYTQLGVTVSV